MIDSDHAVIWTALVKWSAAFSAFLCFNSHFFPREPGLASVYWSKGWWKWWWQLELQDVQSPFQIVTTNKPTPNFLQAASCRPTNSVKALKGKYHIPWTCLPQVQLTLTNLGECCHASHQPSDASTSCLQIQCTSYFKTWTYMSLVVFVSLPSSDYSKCY